MESKEETLAMIDDLRNQLTALIKRHGGSRVCLWQLRRSILEAVGEPYRAENYYKLSADLRLDPTQLPVYTWGGEGAAFGSFMVKVLSTEEARALRPRGTRPHRILLWCERCQRWIYAGKYGQHARLMHKEGEEK